jgi:hypothetical protein
MRTCRPNPIRKFRAAQAFARHRGLPKRIEILQSPLAALDCRVIEISIFILKLRVKYLISP